MNQSVIKLLHRAAEEVERRGLYKGHLYEPDADPKTCSVCVFGALNVAYNDGGQYEGTPMIDEYRLRGGGITVSADVEYELAETIGAWPPEFNDRAETTADDIIRALRETAERVEREGLSHDSCDHDG